MRLSSRFISFILFTSYLCCSMVPKALDNFLFLPRCTRISGLRAGGVLAQTRRGAQGRSGHAAGRLPDLHHLRRLLVAGQGLAGHHLWDGSRRTRHSAPGTAARRLGRDSGSAQASSQPDAIVLTFCPHLSPELAEVRSALCAVLPSNR